MNVEIEIGDECYDFEVTSFHAPNREESGEITLGSPRRWIDGARRWEPVPMSVVLESYAGLRDITIREAEYALHDEAMALVCDE